MRLEVVVPGLAGAECLTAAGIATKIYNHQLCVLDACLWPLAVRSISDWKMTTLPVCTTCSSRLLCSVTRRCC
jgi:hypothetical protein